MALIVDIPQEAGWFIGTKVVLPFVVYTDDSKNTRQDITGFELLYQLAHNAADETLISKDTDDGVEVTDEAEGEGTITVEASDTTGLAEGYYEHAFMRTNDPATMIWSGTVYLNKAAAP